MDSWKLLLVSRGGLAVAMGFSLIAGSLFAQSAKPRKWKDATGKFEIEATFVGEANGVVTLKQTNGEEVEIELKELSPADEAYVKTQTASSKSPFKSKGAPTPFKSKSTTSTSTPSGSKSTSSGSGPADLVGDPEAVSIEWQNASLIAAPENTRWVAPAIAPPTLKKPKSSPLPAKRDFFESLNNIVTGNGFAILCYTYEDKHNKGIPEGTRLVRVNLDTGKVEGTIIVNGMYSLMDVAPDGEQILMRKEEGFAKPAFQLEVWKPSGKVVERLKVFVPFAAEEPNKRQVEQALFAANGHILVVSRLNGRAGIFNPANGEAVAAVPTANTACLSPDRRYAAILSESLLIVDLNSGEAIATLPTDKKYGSAVAFSPDGKRLAAASGHDVTAWDLTTGETYRDEIYPSMIATMHASFVWTSSSHVLVGSTLIDLENHLPVWTYIGVQKVADYGGAVLLPADGARGAGTLVAANLPHPAAQGALRQALSTPGTFAATPGTAISVDVSGLPDASQQQKAKAGLEARLTAAGFKPAPGASIVLKATLTSENAEMHYHAWGALGTQAVSAPRYTSKIDLVADGKSAWQSTALSGPAYHIQVKKDETLEQAVRNSSKPNYEFFSTVSIPQYVMAPGKVTLGQSAVGQF